MLWPYEYTRIVMTICVRSKYSFCSEQIYNKFCIHRTMPTQIQFFNWDILNYFFSVFYFSFCDSSIQAENTAGAVDLVVESAAFTRPALIFQLMNTIIVPMSMTPATTPPIITGLLLLAEKKSFQWKFVKLC